MEDEGQDVWEIAEHGFTHVYPIIHRHQATGLFFVLSNTDADGTEPDDPPWPPESAVLWNEEGVLVDGGKEFWHDYNDDLGLDAYVEYYDGVHANFGDGWDGGTIQLFRRHSINSGTGYQRKTAINAQWINQFDLTGIDAAQIERAELVISMGGTIFISDDPALEHWNRIPQEIVFRIDQIPLHEYDGWTPTWDDIVDLPSGSSAIPMITSHDVINWSDGVETNPYLDPYQHPDYVWGANSAYPINETGLAVLRNGGMVNVRGGLIQSVIPEYGDFSDLFVEQIYSHWDTYVELDVIEAGAYMPHLRLWLGGGVEIAGEAVMRIGASGAILEQREPTLAHRARLLRDSS